LKKHDFKNTNLKTKTKTTLESVAKPSI